MAGARNAADANVITREYLDSILVEMRLIDAVMPDTGIELFGEHFDTPIMTPAISNLHSFGEGRPSGMAEYAAAAKNKNAVNFFGMTPNEQTDEIYDTGARSIRIIKPFKDKGRILDQIAYSEAHGGFAVGIDIDHIFDRGNYGNIEGMEMGPQRISDIEGYVAATKLPFIAKGVLSVQDAIKCASAGVQGIVVSHHHGRLPYAIPPLMVLPHIAQALHGTGIKIFVDCHIDSGMDVFKALALGADAASFGRVGLIPAVSEGGTEGVEKLFDKMNLQLIDMMAYTGSENVGKISASMLWRDGKPMG